MVKIVVIGYGNIMNGDDAVGHIIAQRLKLNFTHNNLNVYTYQQLVPELVEKINTADLVLFFDAGINTTPGSISIVSVEPNPTFSPFDHYFSPATLAMYNQSLFGTKPLMYLISIAGESFDQNEQLSTPVMIAVKTIVYKLTNMLEILLPQKAIDCREITTYLETLKQASF